MELPVVEDFDVPSLGVILRDGRRVSRDDQFTAQEIYKRTLEALIAEYGSRSLEFCDTGQPEHENDLWAEEMARNPAAVWQEWFDQAGDTVIRDRSEQNPRLSILQLVVLERLGAQEILGYFTLYNIKVETEDAAGFTINAMVVPGMNPLGPQTLETMWTQIMRRMMQFDMTTEDGRIIDLIEWQFPDRGTQNWGGQEVLGSGFSANRVVDLVAVGQDLTKIGDIPLKVRRKPTGPPGPP